MCDKKCVTTKRAPFSHFGAELDHRRRRGQTTPTIGGAPLESRLGLSLWCAERDKLGHPPSIHARGGSPLGTMRDEPIISRSSLGCGRSQSIIIGTAAPAKPNAAMRPPPKQAPLAKHARADSTISAFLKEVPHPRVCVREGGRPLFIANKNTITTNELHTWRGPLAGFIDYFRCCSCILFPVLSRVL